jgi:hypothetical protein
MKVFALLGQVNYEGATLMGIYASKSEAIAARYAMGGEQYSYSNFCVEERVMGAAADPVADVNEYYV